jgi:hypothetical protein
VVVAVVFLRRSAIIWVGFGRDPAARSVRYPTTASNVWPVCGSTGSTGEPGPASLLATGRVCTSAARWPPDDAAGCLACTRFRDPPASHRDHSARPVPAGRKSPPPRSFGGPLEQEHLCAPREPTTPYPGGSSRCPRRAAVPALLGRIGRRFGLARLTVFCPRSRRLATAYRNRPRAARPAIRPQHVGPALPGRADRVVPSVIESPSVTTCLRPPGGPRSTRSTHQIWPGEYRSRCSTCCPDDPGGWGTTASDLGARGCRRAGCRW